MESKFSTFDSMIFARQEIPCKNFALFSASPRNSFLRLYSQEIRDLCDLHCFNNISLGFMEIEGVSLYITKPWLNPYLESEIGWKEMYSWTLIFSEQKNFISNASSPDQTIPRWPILQTAADLKADINLPRKRSQLSTIQFSWQSCQSFDRSNGNRWDTWRSKYAEINHVGTTWCYACTYAESLQTSVQLGRNSWPGSQLLAARRRAFPSTSLSSPARVFIR